MKITYSQNEDGWTAEMDGLKVTGETQNRARQELIGAVTQKMNDAQHAMTMAGREHEFWKIRWGKLMRME